MGSEYIYPLLRILPDYMAIPSSGQNVAPVPTQTILEACRCFLSCFPQCFWLRKSRRNTVSVLKKELIKYLTTLWELQKGFYQTC